MTDLDSLLARVDEINSKSADELTSSDIDTIIAYHRRNRALAAAGIKPTKPKVDLSTILGAMPKPKPTANPFKGKL